MVCFDKTGTLTTDRIDVVGCALVDTVGAPKDPVPVGTRDNVEDECTEPCERKLGALVGVDEVGWHMVCCLALCHSLVPAPVTHKPDSSSNDLKPASAMEQGVVEQGGARAEYIGDPLEIATFAATGASLEVRTCVRGSRVCMYTGMLIFCGPM